MEINRLTNIDELDSALFEKADLANALETYAAMAYGQIELGEIEKSKDYLRRLLFCIRTNKI